jgi:tetratricopeptide (TPR) repeat protein
MAVFEALSVYGMNYVVDPASSYASLSANEAALDYLQFPSQSLSYRAGDCDDLTVLFCALLEASGIETAFITVPGHIYAAFNPGVAAEAMPRYFPRAGDYIVHGGKTWLPVEITMVHDGFLKAWQEGVRQWKEALARNQAAIYPVREAWNLYEPTASVEDARVIAPDKTRVMTRYADSWKRFTTREMADREKTLKDALAKRDTPANRNKLGVLYASYGLYDQAEAQFATGAKEQNVYCMVNMANIRFLRADYTGALAGYKAAMKLDAKNAAALAGAARSEYERENHSSALAWYTKLKEVAPASALAYAYIEKVSGSEDRAGAVGARMAMEWME